MRDDEITENASTKSPLAEDYEYNTTLVTKEDIIETFPVQAMFCIIYSTIFVLGLFGNTLVCYVVSRNRAMQTVTNFFITNLAMADILLCSLGVPFTPMYTFLQEWIFGNVLCHLVAYAQGTSVYISSLTLTSIAIDRYFVIMYPFKPRMKILTCLWIILSVWIFALLATLPYAIFLQYKHDGERYICAEAWPSEEWRQSFSAVTAVGQFAIPLTVITFCYVRVSCKLSDRARAKPGSKNTKKEAVDRDRKRRTNRMLIAVVSVFGVSWLPLSLVNLLNDLYIHMDDWEYYNLCFFTAHAVAMGSTLYNPILYAWLNDNFRKEFKQVLPCFPPTVMNGKPRSCRFTSDKMTRNGTEMSGFQESVCQTQVYGNVNHGHPLKILETIEEQNSNSQVKSCEEPSAEYSATTNQVEIHLPQVVNCEPGFSGKLCALEQTTSFSLEL